MTYRAPFVIRKVGRDALTGRFIRLARARNRRATATVETMKYRIKRRPRRRR